MLVGRLFGSSVVWLAALDNIDDCDCVCHSATLVGSPELHPHPHPIGVWPQLFGVVMSYSFRF